MKKLVDRLILKRPLSKSAIFRLECNGAPVDGTVVICPAGTTFELVQGMVVLHFWEAFEPVLVFPQEDVEVRPAPTMDRA